MVEIKDETLYLQLYEVRNTEFILKIKVKSGKLCRRYLKMSKI